MVVPVSEFIRVLRVVELSFDAQTLRAETPTLTAAKVQAVCAIMAVRGTAELVDFLGAAVGVASAYDDAGLVRAVVAALQDPQMLTWFVLLPYVRAGLSEFCGLRDGCRLDTRGRQPCAVTLQHADTLVFLLRKQERMGYGSSGRGVSFPYEEKLPWRPSSEFGPRYDELAARSSAARAVWHKQDEPGVQVDPVAFLAFWLQHRFGPGVLEPDGAGRKALAAAGVFLHGGRCVYLNNFRALLALDPMDA